jgi:predicted O-methyltransferase YrrM
MSTVEPPARLDRIHEAPVLMTPPERVVLYSAVYGLRPRRSLEIGTFRGGSAMIIVSALDDIGDGSLTCIDPNPQIEPEVLRQIEHRATVHAVPSPEGLAGLASAPEDRFEFALIDGDHSYDGLVRDIEGVLEVLADDALILFHDAHFYEVADAIDAMLVRHADRLVDCGMVSTLQVPEDQVREGRPVIWGGLRMLRVAGKGQRGIAASAPTATHPVDRDPVAARADPATPTAAHPRAYAPAPTRIEKARHRLESGDARAWAAPSRFGPGGHAARAALRRIAQPLTVRQRQIDEELLASIEELWRNAPPVPATASGAPPSALDVESVVDVETPHGPFFVQRADAASAPLPDQDRFSELAEIRFVVATLRPGQTMLDVGASFGYFSVVGAELVGPEGMVIAVEPDARKVDVLRANLWRRGAQNAFVLAIAAHSDRSFLPFAGGALVPAARLDEMLPEARVDFAKVATRGMDAEVVAGLEGLLLANPELVVLCEFSLTGIEDRHARAGAVLERYQGLGLKLALLDEDGTPQPATSGSVLTAAAAAESQLVKLVLTRA